LWYELLTLNNELETDSSNNNIRYLYRGISDFKKGYQCRITKVRDEKGDMFAHWHSILMEDSIQILNVNWVNDLMFTGPCNIVITEESKKPTRCHLIFYCTCYRFNVFQALLCPSSGVHDYDVVYHIGHVILGLLYVGG